MICINKLTKKFTGGKHALHNCELTVDEKSVAILGENGAGKTTLARLICGIISPTSGEITIDGKPVNTPDGARSIGYVPARTPLSPTLSLKENLSYMAELRGLEAGAVSSAIKDAGCTPEEASIPVGTLNTLNKKKANLAQALLGSPRYLILDQPLSSLSIDDEAEMRDLLFELEDRYTFIYLTDSPDEARYFCSEVLVLSLGKTVAKGSLEEIFEHRADNDDYKARVRGEKERLLDALESDPRILHHKVSITSGGTAIIELTVSSAADAPVWLNQLFAQADCKVIDLKKADSPLERVISQLYKNQEEKLDKRREEEEEKAPPVKLNASSITFRHDKDSENDEDMDESHESYDLSTREQKKQSSVKSEFKLGFHHIDDDDDTSEDDDGGSTLFSSRDD
ncbi:MAG: ABC transporter ATP-binding protein [Clostridia bacterium]|nr:ABC transporter ATP-binding protein [Clostridia bacterium]